MNCDFESHLHCHLSAEVSVTKSLYVLKTGVLHNWRAGVNTGDVCKSLLSNVTMNILIYKNEQFEARIHFPCLVKLGGK